MVTQTIISQMRKYMSPHYHRKTVPPFMNFQFVVMQHLTLLCLHNHINTTKVVTLVKTENLPKFHKIFFQILAKKVQIHMLQQCAPLLCRNIWLKTTVRLRFIKV